MALVWHFRWPDLFIMFMTNSNQLNIKEALKDFLEKRPEDHPCNVMVTRPTNHMISTRDHSHDLLK